MEEVSVIFDLGKTNKKLLVFNRELNLIQETRVQIPEKTTADGYLVDDVEAVEAWMFEALQQLGRIPNFRIAAINLTTFGATVAHLDARGHLAMPVFSYASPQGDAIHQDYVKWMSALPGGFARHATPPLPQFLNVGKQLYWIQREKPHAKENIRSTLFLPQYFLYRLTGRQVADPTSYGCHTGLWDFQTMQPSQIALQALEWEQNMPALVDPTKETFHLTDQCLESFGLEMSPVVGCGLHDSSSALVPYLVGLQEPFTLVSTGTWIIVLNPFARFYLSEEDLQRDRLYYLRPDKKPTRAARLFAGREHDIQVQRIKTYFGKTPVPEGDIEPYLQGFISESRFRGLVPEALSGSGPFPQCPPGEWDVSGFATAEEAYARLCLDLAVLTDYCISEVGTEDGQTIIVDGGFARNPWFVKLIAMLQKPNPVYVAEVPEATALGAALLIHPHWTQKEVSPEHYLKLKKIDAAAVPGLKVYAEHLLSLWEACEPH